MMILAFPLKNRKSIKVGVSKINQIFIIFPLTEKKNYYTLNLLNILGKNLPHFTFIFWVYILLFYLKIFSNTSSHLYS